MEITILRYFLEIAKTENITKAAEKLNITQPTLSRQIKQLENELGQKLFSRHAFSVKLTTSGRRFQENAEKIVRLADQTIAEFSAKDEAVSGNLRIACVEDALVDFVPDILTSFRKKYRNIRIDFYSGGTQYIRSLINNNECDIAIMYFSDVYDTLEILDTGIRRNLGIIMQQRDPHAKEPDVYISELYQLPLFSPRKDAVDIILNNHNINYDDLKIFATFDDPVNYLELIRRDANYMLCLELAQEDLTRNELCFRPLAPQITTSVGIVRNRNTADNKLIDIFFEHSRIYC